MSESVEQEPIDYRAELFNLLELVMQLGLQIQVQANNMKAQIQEKEQKK